MKVLHYADCADLSFLVPWLDLMGGLAEKGVKQALLCRPGGSVERTAKERGIATYTWRPPIAAAPFLNFHYPALIRSITPDLVHTRLSAAAGIAGYWGNALGTPSIATFDKPAKAKYYRRVDHYISCAKWLKDYMVREQNLPKGRIDVVYNSVDLAKYAYDEAERKRFRESHGIGPEQKVFSGLGIYIPRKAFEVLIRAFAAVSEGRDDLILMLIGDGELRETYLQMIEELGLQGRVIMPEAFVKDVRPWLWGSDYYVMPSREEGFSIALLEVMAAGLPVIVSDIPAFTEIIENGVNGLVAGVDDPESFARAMAQMLHMSEGEMEQLKRRSFETIANFANEAIVERTIEVYEKVLTGGRRRAD